MPNEIVPVRTALSLAPQSFEQAVKFAELVAASDLVPKDYVRKPGNVLVAVQMGAELGLAPMQAIQNIAVINGRPSVWGDAALALVKASPVYEYIAETLAGEVATCRVKRRGEPEAVRTFSVADAKRAGLWGKQGPWTQYPTRMLQLRARAFALRDVFPDVLRGLQVAEEQRDIPAASAEMLREPDTSALPAPVEAPAVDTPELVPPPEPAQPHASNGNGNGHANGAEDWLAAIDGCSSVEELEGIRKQISEHFNRRAPAVVAVRYSARKAELGQ